MPEICNARFLTNILAGMLRVFNLSPTTYADGQSCWGVGWCDVLNTQ